MAEYDYNPAALRLAVLVDGDNAQPDTLQAILGEVNSLGAATIRRIYGDWTLPTMNSWKQHLHVLAFQPIQQFQNTKGKNATDSMLIIDAMDILHTVPIDGFFIVSSDSDYTRLASRIREQGKLVYGVGEQKTPESFVNACDRFIYVEIIMGSTKDNVLTEEKFEKLVVYSRAAFYQSIGDTDEWADLGQFGNNLRKIDPSFDSRSYGFSQLSKLLEYLPDVFELKRVKPNNVIHVRMK